MKGIAIPEGNNNIFQKKLFFIYLFSSLKLKKKKKKKVLRKKQMGGRLPTKGPRMARPPLGPSGVASHQGVARPPWLLPGAATPRRPQRTSPWPSRGDAATPSACYGWPATHLIFWVFDFFFFFTHTDSYRGWLHHPQTATTRPFGGGAGPFLGGQPPIYFFFFFLVQLFFLFFFFKLEIKRAF